MVTTIPQLTHLISAPVIIIIRNQNQKLRERISPFWLRRSLTTPTTSFNFHLSCAIPSSFLASSMGKNAASTNNGEESGTNPPMSTNTVRVVVKGRVQGVFYRDWTVENARGLGLKGWVRNRRDGSVEALFSGDPNSVNDMEEKCRRGPRDALVTSLQVFPSNDDPGLGFKRYPTV